jgi:N-acyl-D-aspartate/D-glutamate deacylase
MSGFDVVIRNGTLLDGSGGEPRSGDVALAGSRIARVGRVAERGSPIATRRSWRSGAA